jgi:RecA/RadA recombinase
MVASGTNIYPGDAGSTPAEWFGGYTMQKDVELMRKALKHKQKTLKPKAMDYLSSGSAMVNMAVSGHPNRCFAKGHYYFFVGDSSSGKTFLVLTCLAEACRNPEFDKYRLIYNGTTEKGALMDMQKFFGRRVVERLKVTYSDTIEEFYYDLDDRLDAGKPMIYILDSMDGLNSEDDYAKFDEQKQAHRKGKQVAGSYGDGKAKKNSQTLRKMLTRLHKTGSILIIISQTRDNLGFGFDKKTRAGGRSLKCYAALEMWTSVYKHIKKNYKGKDREQGIIAQVQIKKNRIAGRDRTVQVPIYHSYGIDNVGSMVDYLVEEKHWKKSKGGIKAPEFDFKGHRDKLIKHIEEEDCVPELKTLTQRVWQEIEEAVAIKRRSRYE